MKVPRLLDLFCGAGGCSMGYARAGFEVVGVDHKPQPRYPFSFHQADALEYLRLHGADFDVIHASPPCQAYSALRHLHPDKQYPDMIDSTRKLLIELGVPWIIENVPGASLRFSVQLCGSAFRLRVRRHRRFQASVRIDGVVCCHKLQGRPIDVSGTGGRRITRRPGDKGGNTNKPLNIAEARAAMGVDWPMTRMELSQAIPPAFTTYIGKQLFAGLLT
jgi:DNA (cytosine-5)-methyltransferase 1